MHERVTAPHGALDWRPRSPRLAVRQVGDSGVRQAWVAGAAVMALLAAGPSWAAKAEATQASAAGDPVAGLARQDGLVPTYVDAARGRILIARPVQRGRESRPGRGVPGVERDRLLQCLHRAPIPVRGSAGGEVLPEQVRVVGLGIRRLLLLQRGAR